MTRVIAIRSSEDRRHAASLVDADGNPTDDPGQAVRGELLEYDPKSKQTRRTWFRFEQVEVKWLPVSEAAFLLWVLVLLVAVWVGICMALGLF